ncbi:MAG: diacylglycerol kinase family lipid kinase [Verrucomicrobia bacterium]|nr:diacylglycerol kinase family lipid kinase [Verrucomicrobiota bacterium]
MRACVIFNPTAKGDKARHFRRHLSDFAGDVALKPTTAAGHGRMLAAEAINEGFDTLVAAGGDGTVNEVLNGIGDAPNGFARARLAVLPLGTVNVFARELGVPLKLSQAWEVIRAGRERTMDLPFVEFDSPTGSVGGPPAVAGETPALPKQTQRRYFAQMAGAGLDARAIELVDWEHKKRVSQLAYIIAGFRALRRPLPQIHCECDGGAASGEQVLIGNGRFYGGPLPVFHRASLTDGLLDVCVFPKVSIGTVLRYASGFVTGRVFPPRDMRYLQAEKITLSSAESARFEIEGDVVGELPATFGLVTRGLRVVTP